MNEILNPQRKVEYSVNHLQQNKNRLKQVQEEQMRKQAESARNHHDLFKMKKF